METLVMWAGGGTPQATPMVSIFFGAFMVVLGLVYFVAVRSTPGGKVVDWGWRHVIRRGSQAPIWYRNILLFGCIAMALGGLAAIVSGVIRAF